MHRDSNTVRVSVDKIGVRRHPSATVVVVGNPNSGKSTLFNRLTGLRQRTANFPGVTVEKHIGVLRLDDIVLELVDLPGMFALSSHSLEERIAVDVLFGRMPDVKPPDGILAVLDTTNLYQGLYLLQQLLTLNVPVLVALTMTDAAKASGLRIDVDALKKRLGGVEIYPVVATSGQGISALRTALAKLPSGPKPELPTLWQELSHASEELIREMPVTVPRIEIERALIDHDSDFYRELIDRLGSGGAERVDAIRKRLFDSDPPLAREARRRYGWVREVLAEVQQSAPAIVTWGSHVSSWVNRPVPGTAGLFVVMAIVFQAVFAWATPLMDLIDHAASILGTLAASALPAGAIASFVSDGIIAGVGSVIVFLPQILIATNIFPTTDTASSWPMSVTVRRRCHGRISPIGAPLSSGTSSTA
jgi:ferrous iron transport protein B